MAQLTSDSTHKSNAFDPFDQAIANDHKLDLQASDARQKLDDLWIQLNRQPRKEYSPNFRRCIAKRAEEARERKGHTPKAKPASAPKQQAPKSQTPETCKVKRKPDPLVAQLAAIKINDVQKDIALQVIGILQKAHRQGKEGAVIDRSKVATKHKRGVTTIETVLRKLRHAGITQSHKAGGNRMSLSSLSPAFLDGTWTPPNGPSTQTKAEGPSLTHVEAQTEAQTEAPTGSNTLHCNGSQPPLSLSFNPVGVGGIRTSDTNPNQDLASTVGLRTSLDATPFQTPNTNSMSKQDLSSSSNELGAVSEKGLESDLGSVSEVKASNEIGSVSGTGSVSEPVSDDVITPMVGMKLSFRGDTYTVESICSTFMLAVDGGIRWNVPLKQGQLINKGRKHRFSCVLSDNSDPAA